MTDMPLVLIRGAGDLASGAALRLYAAGFPVVMTELEKPLFVRRAVCFGNAVFEGSATVEGVPSRLIEASSALWLTLRTEEIPVIIDRAGEWRDMSPMVVVDARMAKEKLDTSIKDADCVIALGPGFVAGADCHAVIETNRGHRLGRVIWQGSAEANTGIPGDVKGIKATRVLRSPADGFVTPLAEIGDQIREGQTIATVADRPVVAAFDGRLRGLVHPSLPVHQGMKIGDLDPRGEYHHCFTISDKSLAVGGAVLTAILQAGCRPMSPDELVRKAEYAAS